MFALEHGVVEWGDAICNNTIEELAMKVPRKYAGWLAGVAVVLVGVSCSDDPTNPADEIGSIELSQQSPDDPPIIPDAAPERQKAWRLRSRV